MTALLLFVIGVAAHAVSLFFAFGCGLTMEKACAESSLTATEIPIRDRGLIVLYFLISIFNVFAGMIAMISAGKVV